MSTKADFYIGEGNKTIKWLGSKCHDGYPDGIPTDILIQINEIMFTEMVLEFLMGEPGDSIIAGEEPWPWLWSDSRMTDYSYIFLTDKCKVAASNFGKELFDPIVIKQGEDLIAADLGIGKPEFPIMRRQTFNQTTELIKKYGS